MTGRHEMASDLGPLLAAVTDEWQTGLTIARRAGINPRTAGPRLGALRREGMVVTSTASSARGVRLYRRGPNAPPVAKPDPVTPAMIDRGARVLAAEDGDTQDYELNAGQTRDYHRARAEAVLRAALEAPDAH